MYGIFTYSCLILMVTVSKYTIHGSYGSFKHPIPAKKVFINNVGHPNYQPQVGWHDNLSQTHPGKNGWNEPESHSEKDNHLRSSNKTSMTYDFGSKCYLWDDGKPKIYYTGGWKDLKLTNLVTVTYQVDGECNPTFPSRVSPGPWDG